MRKLGITTIFTIFFTLASFNLLRACPVTVSVSDNFYTFCYEVGATFSVDKAATINGSEATLSTSTANCVTYSSESVKIASSYSLNDCTALTSFTGYCNDTNSLSLLCLGDVCTISLGICWDNAENRPAPGYYEYNGVPLMFTENNANCLSASYAQDLEFPKSDGLSGCVKNNCPVSVTVSGSNYTFCYELGATFTVNKSALVNGADATSVGSTANCVTYNVSAKVALSAPYSLGSCSGLSPYEGLCPDYGGVSACTKGSPCETQWRTICWEDPLDKIVPGFYSYGGIAMNFVDYNENCLRTEWSSADGVTFTNEPATLDGCREKPECPISYTVADGSTTICYPSARDLPALNTTVELAFDSGILNCKVDIVDEKEACIVLSSTCEGKLSGAATTVSIDGCPFIYLGQCPDREFSTQSVDVEVCDTEGNCTTYAAGYNLYLCWDNVAERPAPGSYMYGGVELDFTIRESDAGCLTASWTSGDNIVFNSETPILGNCTLPKDCPQSVHICEDQMILCYDQETFAKAPKVGETIGISYNGTANATCNVATVYELELCISIDQCQAKQSYEGELTSITVNGCEIKTEACPLVCPATISIEGDNYTFCYKKDEKYFDTGSASINGLKTKHVRSSGNCVTYATETGALAGVESFSLNGCDPISPYTGLCPDDIQIAQNCRDGVCINSIHLCWGNAKDVPADGYYEYNGAAMPFKANDTFGNCIVTSYSDNEKIEFTNDNGLANCKRAACAISYATTDGVTTICYDGSAGLPTTSTTITLDFDTGKQTCQISAVDTKSNCITLSDKCEGAFEATAPSKVSINGCPDIYIGQCPDSQFSAVSNDINGGIVQLYLCWDDPQNVPDEGIYVYGGVALPFKIADDREGCITTGWTIGEIEFNSERPVFGSCKEKDVCPSKVYDCGSQLVICYEKGTFENAPKAGDLVGINFNGTTDGNCTVAQVFESEYCVVLSDCKVKSSYGDELSFIIIDECKIKVEACPLECPATVSVEGTDYTFCYPNNTKYAVFKSSDINGVKVAMKQESGRCITYSAEEIVDGSKGYSLNGCDPLTPYSGFCPDYAEADKNCQVEEIVSNCTYTLKLCWNNVNSVPSDGYYEYNGVALAFKAEFSSPGCIVTTYTDADKIEFTNENGLANCTRLVCPETVSVSGSNYTFCYPSGSEFRVEKSTTVNGVDASLVSSNDNCVTYEVNAKVAISAPYALGACEGIKPFDGPCPDSHVFSEPVCDDIACYQTVTYCWNDKSSYPGSGYFNINGVPYEMKAKKADTNGYCLSTVVTIPRRTETDGVYLFEGCDYRCPSYAYNCNGNVTVCYDKQSIEYAPKIGEEIIVVVNEKIKFNCSIGASDEGELCLTLNNCKSESTLTDVYLIAIDACDPIKVEECPYDCPIAASTEGNQITFCYKPGSKYPVYKSTTINGEGVELVSISNSCLTYQLKEGTEIKAPFALGHCDGINPQDIVCPLENTGIAKECWVTIDSEGNQEGDCSNTVTFCWGITEDVPEPGLYVISGALMRLEKTDNELCRTMTWLDSEKLDIEVPYSFKGCYRPVCAKSAYICEKDGLTVCYDSPEKLPKIGTQIRIKYDNGAYGVCTAKTSDRGPLCINFDACEFKTSSEESVPAKAISVDGCQVMLIEECPVDCPVAVQIDGLNVTVCYEDDAYYKIDPKPFINGAPAELIFASGKCITYKATSNELNTVLAPVDFNGCILSPYEGTCPDSSEFKENCTTEDGIKCEVYVQYCWENKDEFPKEGKYIINDRVVGLKYVEGTTYCLEGVHMVDMIDRPTEYVFETCRQDCPVAASIDRNKITVCYEESAKYDILKEATINGYPYKLLQVEGNCLIYESDRIVDRAERVIFEECIIDPYNGICPDFEVESELDCRGAEKMGYCLQKVTYCWNNKEDYPGEGIYFVNGATILLVKNERNGDYCLTGLVRVLKEEIPSNYIFEHCRENCPLSVDDMTDGTYRVCFDTDFGLVEEGRTGFIMVNDQEAKYLRNDDGEGYCIVVELPTGIKEFAVGRCPAIVPQVLPIELIHFHADYLPGIHAAEITWITVMELNVDFYQLERSLDGRTFEPIHYVRDIEDTNWTMTYRHIDDLGGIADQIIYYRLKNVDHDGSYDYSETIPLRVGGKSRTLVTLFPNPVKDFVNVVIPGGTGKLIVYDVYGRTKLTYDTQEGDILVKLDLSGFTAGSYFIRYIDEKNKINEGHKITVVWY